MFDEEITLLCFFNRDSIERIKKTFPNMTEENISILYDNLKNGNVPMVIKNGIVINPKSDENILKQKEEFKKRFCFIYENSKELIEFGCPISNHLGFNFMKWLEELVLGNIPLEETYLYKSFKKEKEQFESEIENYSTIRMEHYIWNKARVIGDNSKDTWELLSHLVWYIRSRENSNSYNNEKELEALDEYFRVLRYSNDGIVWKSGFDLEGEDLAHALFLFDGEREKMVNYFDTPELEGNEFLSCFADSLSKKDGVHFTEKEKQEIYLKYHDELPWDFSVTCSENKELALPKICKPCNKTVLVQENDIFVSEDNGFYCMCDSCGYIIPIQKEGINPLVQHRITDRCYPRSNLFKKMLIYSELQALDREDGIKVLENIEEDSGLLKKSYILERFKNKRGN